jgi:hypothetical protein
MLKEVKMRTLFKSFIFLAVFIMCVCIVQIIDIELDVDLCNISVQIVHTLVYLAWGVLLIKSAEWIEKKF